MADGPELAGSSNAQVFVYPEHVFPTVEYTFYIMRIFIVFCFLLWLDVYSLSGNCKTLGLNFLGNLSSVVL